MNISDDETYEEIAATYQCLEIARLNEILKTHGIRDKRLRERICSDFFAESGAFLDSGWFKGDEKKVTPEICFSERDESREIRTLYMRSKDFAFHEYAAGDVYWYFDEHQEDASEIETGTDEP